MKRLLMVLMLLVVFVFANGGEPRAAAIEMKLGHFAADSHSGNLASNLKCLPISGFVMIIYSLRNVTLEIIGIMKPQ